MVSAGDHQCRCLEIRDLGMVQSLEQCDLPCAGEFDWYGDNRFVVRRFVPWFTRDIARDGELDDVSWPEHLEV